MNESSTGMNLGMAERWVSGVGGSALALFGLTRRSLGGVALAALGGALVYRGVSGHCPVYEALGVGGEPTPAREADVVDESSELSFPASDAPAWTPTVGVTH